MTLDLLEVLDALPARIWLPLLIGIALAMMTVLIWRRELRRGGNSVTMQFVIRSGVLVSTSLAVLCALAVVTSVRLGLEGLLPTAVQAAATARVDIDRAWRRDGRLDASLTAVMSSVRGYDQRIVLMSAARFPCTAACGAAWVGRATAAEVDALHARFSSMTAGRATAVDCLGDEVVAIARAPLRDRAGTPTALLLVAISAAPVITRATLLAWQLLAAAIVITGLAMLATATAVRRTYASRIRGLIEHIGTQADVVDDPTLRDELTQLSVKVNQLVEHAVDLGTALQEAHRLESVGRLAGGVAHEFNNLMSSVLGNTELAMRSLPAAAPERIELQAASDSARRAAALTDKLLQYSGQRLHPQQPLDLNALLRRLHTTLLRITGESVLLHALCYPTPLMIVGDERQMEQLLLELAENACAAMPTGGVLRIRTRAFELFTPEQHHGLALAPGNYARVDVSDTGVGLSTEALARVFEPFFSTRPFRPAAGLGLAAVHGIVKMHRGGIAIESTEGSGTAVRVLLPLFEA